MRVLVTGSHDFSKPEQVTAELNRRLGHRLPHEVTIVTGGGQGPDQIAADWATARGLPVESIPADFTEDEKAGVKRNGELLDRCEQAIIFWDGESPNTHDLITRASKRKDYPVAVLVG